MLARGISVILRAPVFFETIVLRVTTRTFATPGLMSSSSSVPPFATLEMVGVGATRGEPISSRCAAWCSRGRGDCVALRGGLTSCDGATDALSDDSESAPSKEGNHRKG